MAGVYISYPFCGQKCSYCNFASGPAPAAREMEYAEALAGEIREHRWQWTPETCYVGGGSPSRMAPETLQRILGEVPGRPWKEATLEAAPGEVTADKARAWAASGITRVSLGVQSFVVRELALTGRKHSPEVVVGDVKRLREAGITRINIDLIAGLPHQTRESWRESLEWTGRLGVGHVSVYMLEVDEGSRLGRELLAGGRRYGAGEVPDEELIAELYERAVERLSGLGLERYEISNFARPGEESWHNLKYWRLEPYAGFGAGAHSFDGRVRRRNAERVAEYMARRRRGEEAWVEQAAANVGEERFFLGLRLREGIELSPDEWREFEEAVGRYASAGLLERVGKRLRLTGRGVLLSNEVLQELIGR